RNAPHLRKASGVSTRSARSTNAWGALPHPRSLDERPERALRAQEVETPHTSRKAPGVSTRSARSTNAWGALPHPRSTNGWAHAKGGAGACAPTPPALNEERLGGSAELLRDRLARLVLILGLAEVELVDLVVAEARGGVLQLLQQLVELGLVLG